MDFLPAENGREMQHLLWVRCQVYVPRLLERLDVEESDSAEMLDHRVGVELSFAEQIRLILADMIRPQLVGRTVEVSRELVNGLEISARGAGCVVSTLEFFEHQLSKMGHWDLLVTAPYRDSAPAANDDQHRRVCTRSVCRQASLRAGHAQQLGGESPPPNLMEVKG